MADEINITELWREVVGFPDYEVSDLGHVRRITVPNNNGGRNKRYPRLLTLVLHHSGRIIVSLFRDNKGHQRFVSRLVVESFVGPQPLGMECAHSDGDYGNNRLSNLSWKTHIDNMADQIAHGTRIRGETAGMSKLTDQAVREIRSAGNIRRGDIARMARLYGVKWKTVYCVLRGETWRHVK